MHLSLVDGDGAARRDREHLLDELRAAGQPVIEIELDDPIDLAGEMARWEVATAFAGAVLGIDPFDQPNVEEAKERTREVLANVGSGDEASGESNESEDGGIRCCGDTSGMRSPIFHLKRFANARPMTAPLRVFSHACFCSSGSRISG